MTSAMRLRVVKNWPFFRIIGSVARGAETLLSGGCISNTASGRLLLEMVSFFVRVRTIILMLELTLELLFQVILSIIDFLLQTCTGIVANLSRLRCFRWTLRGSILVLNFANLLQSGRSSSSSLQLNLLLMSKLGLQKLLSLLHLRHNIAILWEVAIL